ALYKQLKPLQARYEEREKAFESLLSRQEEVEGLLADPVVYADGAKATELLKEFHTLQEKTEKEMEELGELEQQIAILEEKRAALSLEGME
ncbi:MAG: ABC transporter ATP-binding protein, partial [Mailhella sp.]